MGIKLVLVHGFRPQVNEQCASKGHVSRFSHGMRITDAVALDCAAGGRRPAALRDRGRLLARACPTRPWPMPPCAWCRATSSPRGRWASSTASTSSTAAWCARSIRPCAKAIDIGRAGAARPSAFAHRRGLQPDDGRRGHQHRHRAAGRQAALRHRPVPGIPREGRRPESPSTPNCAGRRRKRLLAALARPPAHRPGLLPAALRARPAAAA